LSPPSPPDKRWGMLAVLHDSRIVDIIVNIPVGTLSCLLTCLLGDREHFT